MEPHLGWAIPFRSAMRVKLISLSSFVLFIALLHFLLEHTDRQVGFLR